MLNFSYCPKCGSKISNKTTHYECGSCGYELFPHSAATASVLPIKGDKVLLARRAQEPEKGSVDLLGGFLNYGEDPREGALREMKEETGCDIKILDLLGIYMDEYFYQNENISTLNFVYVAEIKSGEPEVADDVAEVFWHPISDVPKGLAFKTVEKALIDLQKWYKNNSLSG